MLNQTKILLVEDDPMVVRMYKKKLEFDGFKLTLAYNGEEGLEALKKELPDIVLLDIMMPKMNGIEMLQIVKNHPEYKNIPVVILTNLDDRAEDIKKVKTIGAEAYWIKANMPIGEVSEKIRAMLAGKRLSAANHDQVFN